MLAQQLFIINFKPNKSVVCPHLQLIKHAVKESERSIACVLSLSLSIYIYIYGEREREREREREIHIHIAMFYQLFGLSY